MKLKKIDVLDYKCDGCHNFKTHKDMFDECICYNCYDKRGENHNPSLNNDFKRVPLTPETPRVFGYQCPECKEIVGSCEIGSHVCSEPIQKS